MPSELTKPARKLISKWARQEFYVYLHPLSSRFIDPTMKPTVYWVVSVEARGFSASSPFKTWRAEGFDLSATIIGMADQIPNKKMKQTSAGWLAPKEVFDKEVERAKKRQTKAKKKSNVVPFERPRRKKKSRAPKS